MVDAVGATAFTYTSFGALLSEDGPWDADTVTYGYANRLRNSLSLRNPGASAWSQSYTYDGLARLTNLVSPAGAFAYTYRSGLADDFSDPTNPDGATLPTIGNLVSRVGLPNGAYIAQDYDFFGRLTSTALKTSGNVNTNVHSYVLDLENQRIQQTRTDGSYVDYGYDATGQLLSAQGKESAGTTNRWQERFSYTYDPAGNLSNRVQNVLTNVFNVNTLNELASIVRTNSSLTVAGTSSSAATNVTVADNGNSAVAAIRYADATFARTNVTLLNGTNTFVAVGLDSLGRTDTNTVVTYLPTAITCLYDLNGNLRTNGVRLYEYDDENQLIDTWVSGVSSNCFLYDGKLRRRITRDYTWNGSAWVLAREVRYVYDGNLVIQERDQFNMPQLCYTRGMDMSGGLEGAGGIGGLLALSAVAPLSPQHYYYHADGNGNVTALLNTNQQIVARYMYDPFGNTLSATGPMAEMNLCRFSSKELHPASGLVYYLYRFYDPNTQRWPNRDPLQGQTPQKKTAWGYNLQVETEEGINLYWPFRNDPVSNYDKDGQMIIPLLICAGAIGAIAALACGCRKAPKPPPDVYPNCWDATPTGKIGVPIKLTDCKLCCALNYGGATPEGGDDGNFGKCLVYCLYMAVKAGGSGAVPKP